MPPAPLRPETRNIIPENANAVTGAVGVGDGEDREVKEAELHEALDNSASAVSVALPQVNGKHGGISTVPKKDVLQPPNTDLPVSLKGCSCPSSQSTSERTTLNFTDSPQISGLPTTSQSGLGSDHVEQKPQQSSPVRKDTRYSTHAPENRLSEQILEPLTVKKIVSVNSASKLTSSP